MVLAHDIAVTLRNEEIHLVPRLRYAMRLERRDGSFAKLVRQVADESLSAVCEIILPHCPDIAPSDVFDAGLSDLKWPLITYVEQCTGIDPDDVPAKGKSSGKTIPLGEHLLGLYRIGTGWLGWTPEQTLDATPAEIKEAYRGRLEMLKAIFGGGDEKPKPKEDWGNRFAFTARARAKAKEAQS